jgi:hypothetical protein
MVGWIDDEPQRPEDDLPFELPDGARVIKGDEALSILGEMLPRPSVMFVSNPDMTMLLRHMHLPDAIVTEVPDDPNVALTEMTDDTPKHKVMMTNVLVGASSLGALLMHEADVVALRDMLNAWLEYPEAAILSTAEAAPWISASMNQLHNDRDLRFKWGLFDGVWREWSEADDHVDHVGDDEIHNAWEPI